MSYIPEHYSYRIIWLEEEQEYVGLCTEFPSCSWGAPTPQLALEGIIQIVSEALEALTAQGCPIPKPIWTDHTNEITIKTTPELKEFLELKAIHAGLSIPAYVDFLLSQGAFFRSNSNL